MTRPIAAGTAWVIEWTEFERGWGCRPDGCYFYASPEDAMADTKARLTKIRAYEAAHFTGVPDEYSQPDDAAVLVQVTQEILDEITNAGQSYRSGNNKPFHTDGTHNKYYKEVV